MHLTFTPANLCARIFKCLHQPIIGKLAWSLFGILTVLLTVGVNQHAMGQGYGFSYTYSTTGITRINNGTGAQVLIYTFTPATPITQASALAVDLNGDIYFTDSQNSGANLYKFVPNTPPAMGGTLSLVGAVTATFNDVNNVSRALQFGKLAINTSGQLFTISNYNATNTGNLASRPYIVNLNKATAAVVSVNDIPLPTGGVTDLPITGGDIDFSPTGRLFVSGANNVAGVLNSAMWEINTVSGAILGYKSVPQVSGATYNNFSGMGFDLQGNVLVTATSSTNTANNYILRLAASNFSGTTSWSGNGAISSSTITLLSGPVPQAYGDLGSNAFKIAGQIFEDVNYGGGAGRPFGTAGTVGISGARIEVYDASGTFQNFTISQPDGTYAIGVSGNGVFYIRIVNRTVRSTRPGSTGAELGVQTFRSDAVAIGTVVNQVNEVGGRNPIGVDPDTSTIGLTTLNTGTLMLSGSVSGMPESISQLTIGTANVTGINFGFNFSTIVNTNVSGQGSLAQFINNSNILTNAGLDQVANSIFDPLPGVETSIFMIPDGASHPGINKPNQLTAAGGGSTALLNITSLLPVITDATTSIDGRTQTANIGNSQTGVAGHPGNTVGVGAIALPGVQRPEVELHWAGVAGTATYGLSTTGANTTIRGIAVNGFGVGATGLTGNISVGGSGALVTEDIVGGSAISTNTEAAGTNPASNIIFANGGNSASITNSIISRGDYNGVYLPAGVLANNLTISGNEILNNGNGSNVAGILGTSAAGVALAHTAFPATADNNVIINNSITNNGEQGLQVTFGNGLTITNNTFASNGSLSNAILTQLLQLDNIGLISTENTVTSKNIVTGAASSGVTVVGGQSISNKISQNSTYNNAQLGIDLNPSTTSISLVTPNDNGDGDTGPNGLLNFPVITGAVIFGNNLIVKGYSGAGTNIEIFLADRNSSFSPTPPLSPNPLPGTYTDLNGFGEGRTYLLTVQEGGTVAGITDQDATTGVYNDDGTGTIFPRTSNRFQFTIPLASLSGVALNTLLTATATDAGNNTSEFNGVVAVTYANPGDAPNSYSTLSTANGPVHIVTQKLKIGATIDTLAEAPAVPAGTSANIPNGDLADDGLVAPLPDIQTSATTYTLTLPVTNTTGSVANVEGWIDFNRNGVFDPAEAAAITVANNGTSAVLTWNNLNTLITGAGLTGGITYARIRLTTDPLTATSITGLAADGEVEDYSLMMKASYDLSITKTGSPNPVTAGQPLTYTITVTNNGPSSVKAADSITVTELLPTAFSAGTYTPSAGTFTAANGVWTGLSLAPGQSVTLAIAGTVAANATGTLANTAIVTNPPAISDPNLTNDTARQTIPVNRVLDYDLTKVASPKPAVAGQPLNYTITLTNNGPSAMLPADVVTLTDNLPAGFTANSFTPSAGTYTSATGAWTGLSLTTGQSATLVIAGTLSATYTGTNIVNIVTLTPPSGTTDPTPPVGKDSTPVNRVVDLNLTKTATPKPVLAGQSLTYTITLSNAGPATVLPADVITLTDNLPAGFTATSFTPSAGTYTSATGAWTGLTLATGQNATLTIAGTVSASYTGTSLINIVSATPPTGTTDPTPPTAVDTTSVNRVMDLVLAKVGAPKPAVAGQPFTYTITLTNNGPAALLPADAVTLTDNLPAGFIANTFTASAGTYNSATGSWTGLSLNNGQSATITIAGALSAGITGNTLTNTVTATPPPGATDPTPPTATDNTTITRIADLAVTKTDGSATYTPGTTVAYTIVVSNNGPSDVIGATVSDPLPVGITAATWTAVTGAGAVVPASSGSGAINQLVNIPAGSNITYTLTLTVPSGFTGNLVNTANASVPAGYTDNNTGNNTGIDTDTNNPMYGLTATKTAPVSIIAGDAISYTIVFANNGPSDATGVTLQDAIPAQITGVTWTAATQGTATAGTAGGSGNTINLTGNLPAGSGNTITITVNGTVASSASGTITNTASITPPGGTTPIPSNTVNTNITTQTGLNIVKTGPAGGTVAAGNTVTYTIQVTNAGPSDAVNTTIQDNIPAALTNVTWTATAIGSAAITGGSPLNGTGNTINFTSSLPAGGGNAVSITITGTIPSGTAPASITNTASATPAGGTPVTSMVTTNIVNTPTLSITKSGPAALDAGNNISYTIVVTNNGPSDASGAVIADMIPVQITGVSWTTAVTGTAAVTTGNTGTGNMVNVTANVPAGAGNTVTIIVTGKVDPSVKGMLSNVATVTPPGKPTQPSDTVNTNISRNAVLHLTKSGPATISAGQNITYTLLLTNDGPSNATGVQISDVLASQILNPVISASATNGSATITSAALTGNTLAVTGDIAGGSGNSISITVSGQVDPAFAGNIVNNATATPPGMPPVTAPPVTTVVTNDPLVTISKSGPAGISGGSQITYSVIVGNNGPSNASGIAIVDNVPANISNVTWTATTNGAGTTVSAASGTGNINVTGSIPAGATNNITFTITGKVAPSFSGSLTNTASATVPGKTPATDSTTANVTNDPVIQITKSGPASISAGNNISYTITVSNSGASNAINAAITDNIPAGILAPAWTATASGAGTTVNAATGTGNVNVTGNIPAGAGNTITIVVTGQIDPAYAGTPLQNFSQVTIPGKPVVTSDTVTTIITNDPKVQIVKSGPDNMSAGAAITYQLLVTNSGPSNAVGIAITDNLPAALLYASWTATTTGTGTTVSAANGTGNINITGNIPAGNGTILITIHGTVDSSFTGVLTNTATATVPGKTPATSTKNTNITNDPNVMIVKSGPAAISSGQPITYTLIVTNNGLSNATNVAIADNLPGGLQNVTWTAVVAGTGTTVSASSGSGNIAVTGNIPAGAANKITFTVNATVDPAYTGTILSNTATANVPGKTPSTSTVTTNVNNIADLSIQKSGPVQAAAGQTISYTLVVTNAGPANVVGARIQDVLPAELQNAAWTATTTGAGTTVGTANGTGNIDIVADIPAGSANNVTIVVTAKLDPATTASVLVNTATATPPTGTTDPTPATSTVTTTITRQTDLVIVKTGPADKAAGQAISYQLLVTNNGPSDVPGAVIQDAIPAEINNVTFVATANGAAQVTNTNLTGNMLTITGNIPAGTGNSILVNITGVVNGGTLPGTITNTATVTPPPGITETIPGSNTSTINTNINTNVGIQISKSGPAVVNIGEQIVYKVTISNTGSSDATNVAIADNVPAVITNVTWTATATGNGGTTVNTASGSGNNIALTGNIEGTTNGPGEIVLTITGTVSPAAGTSITNTATAVFAGIKSSTFTTAVNNSADLNILKTGPATANGGQQITYTFEVTNAGPASVVGAAILDNVPAAVTNVTWTAAVSGGATVNAATGSGNAINITAGIPAAVGRITVTVNGIIDPAFTGVLNNTATATPPAGMPDPTPATSTVSTTVTNRSGLQVIKSGPATATAGSGIAYAITVFNNGPSNASNLSIDDIVPVTLQNVSWVAVPSGTGAVLTGSTGTGNTIHITGNLPVGSANQIVINVTGTIDPAFTGNITNTASATPQGGTTVTGPPVTTNVVNNAALQIIKTGPAVVSAGQAVTYMIDIVNNGPSNASNISITDVVPAQIQQVAWTAVSTGAGTSVSAGSGTGNNISLTGDIIAGAGNKITITVTGKADPAFTGLISNTASVKSPGGTPISSTVNTNINSAPGLQVVKSGPVSINAGQAIVYTIAVTNAGPSDAINTAIADLVPSQVKNVTWIAGITGTNTVINGTNNGTGNNIQINATIPAGTGNAVNITVNGTVDAAFTGTFSNTATATPPGGTPVTSPPVVTVVTNSPGLKITKSAPATVLANGVVAYVLTITNSGPSDVTGAVITDNVPTGINNVSWTANTSGNAGVTAGNTGTGSVVSVTGNIAAGTGNQIVVNITGQLDPNFSGIKKNVAEVTVPGKPPIPSDTTVTNVQRTANVLISKSGPAQSAAGGNIIYTVDVYNNGPSNLDTINVTDIVPAAITGTSWSAAAVGGNVTFSGPSSGTGNNISIQAGMTNGSELRITISGKLAQTTDTIVTNTAQIVLPPDVVDPGPKTSTVITKIIQQPRVTLNKTGPSVARSGETITYVIEAGNAGPSDAAGVVIKDTVPAALQQVTWTATAVNTAGVTAGSSGTGNNINVAGNIAAGTNNLIRITITGTVPVTFGGTLVNTATANVPNQPPVVTPPVTTIVSKEADLQITKAGPVNIIQGQTLTYQIAVSNNGPATAAGTAFHDVVPAGISNVQATILSQSGGASGAAVNVSGNKVDGTVALLPANGIVNIQITGIASGAGPLNNLAYVTVPPDITDKVPGNDTSSTVTTTVTLMSKLNIAKTVTPGPYYVGQHVTYTLTATNTGTTSLGNVVVTDVLTGNNTGVPVFGTPGQGTVTYNAATHTALWQVGFLNGGQASTLTYNLILSDTNTLVNTAIVTGPPLVSVPDTAVVTVTPKRISDLQITKTGPATVAQGNTITWQIAVTNNGPSDVTGVTFSDAVPTGVTGVSATIVSETGGASGSTLSVNGNNVSGTIGVFPAKGIVNVQITGTAAVAGTLSNTATVTTPPGVIDTVPGNNTTPPVPTVVNKQADLQITKTGPATVAQGNTITWQIAVTNNGPSDVTGVNFSDAVPTGVTGVSATIVSETGGASGSTLNVTGNNVSGTIGVFPAKGIVNVQITGTAAVAGTLSNTATVTTPPGVIDTVPGNNTTPPVPTVVNKQADLQITKTGPATVAQGNTITWQIAVANNGPSDVTGVNFSDAVPTGVTGVSATIVSETGGASGSTLNVTGNNVSGTIGVFPAKGIVNVQITGTAAVAGTLSNTATVTTPPGVIDTVPGNNTTPPVPTVVNKQADLQITKTGPATVAQGNTITWQIAVTNNGPSDVTGVNFSDAVPTGVTGVSATIVSETGGASGSTVSVNGNNVSGTIGVFPAKGIVNVQITGTAAVAVTLSNTATVTTPPGVIDTVPGNNTTPPVPTVVNKQADLQITKTGPATVVQGNTITWQIAVTNNGPSDVTGVNFSDAVPAGVTGVSATIVSETGGASGSTLNVTGNNVSGTIGVFPAKGIVNVQITGTAAVAGTLSNTATVTTPPGVIDTVPGNNTTPPVITDITSKSKLDIIKTVSPGPYNPGQTVTYTLTVTNEGPSTANSVSVKDVITGTNIGTPVFGTPGQGTVSYDATLHTGTWLIGSLTSGQTTTLTYNLVLQDMSTLSNTAIATGPPTTTIPDTAVVVINPVFSADLIVTKTVVTPSPYNVSQRVDYNIKVTNGGPNNATGVIVTDVLPLSFGVPVNIVVPRGEAHFDPGTRSIIWTIGNLPVGEILNLSYTVQIISGGTIENKAVIQGNEPDPVPASNISVVTIDVTDDIFIPNVITPDGDGKNDFFVILGLNKYPGSTLFIYNRWGNMVYQSKNYDNKWNGSGLNDGTYYYILKLNTPQGDRNYKGWIELLHTK